MKTSHGCLIAAIAIIAIHIEMPLVPTVAVCALIVSATIAYASDTLKSRNANAEAE